MRFAIYGSGGLGGYYGIRLCEAGHDVSFIARGAHLEAMRRDGLHLKSPLGDAHLAAPAATDDPGEVGVVDAVLVAVKTWQVPEVARAMRPMVGEGTLVVPFLNGVEASPQLAEALGEGPVLAGLSKIFSLVAAPGRIEHFSQQAYLAIGETPGGESARCRALAGAMDVPGIEIEVRPDMPAQLWRKLVMVSSWAGLGALSRSPMGVIRTMPEIRDLVTASMREAIAVAGARGVEGIGDDFVDELWAFYDTLPEGATASMQRDMMEGKPSELDAWNGAVVRLGAEAGVDTPVHRFTYHTLLPMERRARGEL